jgi:hypothetical protein
MLPRLDNHPALRGVVCFGVILAFICAGCAQTSVQPLHHASPSKLRPPARILVKNFEIDPSVVTEYRGILRQQPSNPDPLARQRNMARHVSKILTAELLDGLRRSGFRAELLTAPAQADDDDLVIEGQCMKIDEGSPLRRWIIGFGSGASQIETRIVGYRGKSRQKTIEFATRADSGRLPGAVATLPASATAPTALGVGIAAGSAVTSGMNAAPSEVSAMAVSSARQAVRYLSRVFAD